MATGTITRLISGKGFGFIKADGDGTDYFFHRSGLGRGSFDELRGGERVEFEIEPSERGPRAGRVQVL